MKKAAIMLYPMFSMQEISCTTELFKFYDKDIITFYRTGPLLAFSGRRWTAWCSPASGSRCRYCWIDGTSVSWNSSAGRMRW